MIDYWVDLCMATQLATRDPSGIAGFMIARGRLPRLEEPDGRKPWEFRGWLLPYVIGSDLAPGLPIFAPPEKKGADPKVIARSLGRWGYWLRIMETGQLPSEDPSPPRILFSERLDTSAPAYRDLLKCCEHLADEVGHSSAPPRLIEWLAWALAVHDEPPRLSEEMNGRLYRQFSGHLWMAEPSDYLGLLLSEFKGRAYDPTAFFPTPESLVRLMHDLVFGDEEFDPERTVCDPCVGTGRFLLGASNHSLRLSGQDINWTCVLATKVNGAFYAPWLSFPLPPGIEGLRDPEPSIEPAAWREPVQQSLFDTVA